MGKAIDGEGAGRAWQSPGWLTELGRLWGGSGGLPVADAQPADIQDLLGGGLFLALYKWFKESGPVYLLPTGPISSFLVVSEPEATKHILRGSDHVSRPIYGKGLVAEVSKFLFGDGFAVAEGSAWRARRKAVGPSLHKRYLQSMVELTFAPCAEQLNLKLGAAAATGEAIDLEACFSQVTLDVIGRALFGYNFGSLQGDSPVIQAVYTALKETETRATDLLPYWKFEPLNYVVPRQRKAKEAVQVIRDVTSELIQKCYEIAQEEGTEAAGEEYVNENDPTILRFLIDAREEVTSTQLRDDLLSMLVAGHETTGSVLTWTAYLLAQNPDCLARAHAEVDAVLGDRGTCGLADLKELKYVMRCINESMRLYPHPPVLIRKALKADTLPGGYDIPEGQDILLSIYNLHRNPDVWEDPDAFKPERFDLDGPVPNEQNTDFKYVPFSGGPRKCVGDQFALMEAQVILAMMLRRFSFKLVPGREIGLTTGATIHTKDGLYVTIQERSGAPGTAPIGEAPATVSPV